MKVTLALIAAIFSLFLPYSLVQAASTRRRGSPQRGLPATKSRRWFNVHRSRRPVRPGSPLRSDGSYPKLRERIDMLMIVSAEYDAEPLFLAVNDSQTFRISGTEYSIRLTDNISEIRLTNMCKSAFLHVLRGGTIGGESIIVTVPPGSYADLKGSDRVLIGDEIVLIYPEQKI